MSNQNSRPNTSDNLNQDEEVIKRLWDECSMSHEVWCGSLQWDSTCDCSIETKRQDIEQFILTELKRVREEMENKIKSLEQDIEEELYGWDCYPNSDKQARGVVELIIQSFKDQEPLKVKKEVDKNRVSKCLHYWVGDGLRYTCTGCGNKYTYKK